MSGQPILPEGLAEGLAAKGGKTRPRVAVPGVRAVKLSSKGG